MDVFAALIKQEMQLWVAGEDDGTVHVCAITEVIDYPSMRVANFFLVAGEEREGWLHHLKSVEEWAVDKGCEKLELRGRKGWEKVLKDWNMSQIVLEKDLL